MKKRNSNPEMFSTLINGYWILSENYYKGYVPCLLTEATRYLGRPYLKTVSVGSYDENGKWKEERKDVAWVSDLAVNCWMPAKFTNQKPRFYNKAKEILGNDCFLSLEVDGLFWVSKGDYSLKIRAKEFTLCDGVYEYAAARKLIGPCVLGRDVEGKLCWISSTVPSVHVYAAEPNLVPNGCWGA
jgi:hypothetical protein